MYILLQNIHYYSYFLADFFVRRCVNGSYATAVVAELKTRCRRIGTVATAL